MTTDQEQTIIRHCADWVQFSVIGCGFCPFAYKVVADNSIRYKVIAGRELHLHPHMVLEELKMLELQPETATTLLIFPDAYEHFSAYLQLLNQSEKLLRRKGFEGIFQLASFHPEYVFGDADTDDPANYTNRSPYPIIHILREAGMQEALEGFREPERIPERNIRFARSKGADYLKALLAKAMGKGH
ncbi:DUF1415 domain-containing protein [Rurimicrobium arvi]|uniref:DUF1415 domain-containing protein n=1 Tax=Rurimicrobium arvi TaxID=2049916 RepID=A0ABP8MQT8_9BACT